MYESILKDLEPMFLKKICINEFTIPKKKEISPYFIPYEKDKLFWCFYIFKHGLGEYEVMENKNIVKEKDEKIKYIEKIRKNKSLLKSHKIKLLSTIESNLLNDEVITLKTFHVLCILENINYLLIDNKFYYEKIVDEDTPIFLLHKNKELYSYEINNTNNYKNTKYPKIEIDKSFQCISSYTIKELKEIFTKLNIEINPSWKKKDLYDYLIKL
jgi:hypothetical protein